jgi:hypothetical protein
MLEGMEYVRKVAETEAFYDENLGSIPAIVDREKARLDGLYARAKAELA